VENNKAMVMACQANSLAVVKLLLCDPRVNPSVREGVSLQKAARGGFTPVVKLLLADPRVDPSQRDNRAIKLAAAKGRTCVVKVLLADPRVNPAAGMNIALNVASDNKHVRVAKLLLADARVDPSDGCVSTIGLACYKGQVAMLQLLMANPRAVVTETELMAADIGGAAVVKLLVDAQPQALLRLFKRAVECREHGPLRRALKRCEARSAMTLLLCVKRRQTDVVAARVADVLREVLSEFTPFQVTTPSWNWDEMVGGMMQFSEIVSILENEMGY
jgi:hypothetical protein